MNVASLQELSTLNLAAAANANLAVHASWAQQSTPGNCMYHHRHESEIRELY